MPHSGTHEKRNMYILLLSNAWIVVYGWLLSILNFSVAYSFFVMGLSIFGWYTHLGHESEWHEGDAVRWCFLLFFALLIICLTLLMWTHTSRFRSRLHQQCAGREPHHAGMGSTSWRFLLLAMLGSLLILIMGAVSLTLSHLKFLAVGFFPLWQLSAETAKLLDISPAFAQWLLLGFSVLDVGLYLRFAWHITTTK